MCVCVCVCWISSHRRFNRGERLLVPTHWVGHLDPTDLAVDRNFRSGHAPITLAQVTWRRNVVKLLDCLQLFGNPFLQNLVKLSDRLQLVKNPSLQNHMKFCLQLFGNPSLQNYMKTLCSIIGKSFSSELHENSVFNYLEILLFRTTWKLCLQLFGNPSL